MEYRSSEAPGRIAIAYQEGAVALHTGRADRFAVYDIRGGIAERGPDIPLPAVSIGFLLAFLQGHRIGAVLAGNTGRGLCAVFEANGVEVIRGVAGPVDDAAQANAMGALDRSDLPCTDHDACTGCGNCG